MRKKLDSLDSIITPTNRRYWYIATSKNGVSLGGKTYEARWTDSGSQWVDSDTRAPVTSDLREASLDHVLADRVRRYWLLAREKLTPQRRLAVFKRWILARTHKALGYKGSRWVVNPIEFLWVVANDFSHVASAKDHRHLDARLIKASTLTLGLPELESVMRATENTMAKTKDVQRSARATGALDPVTRLEKWEEYLRRSPGMTLYLADKANRPWYVSPEGRWRTQIESRREPRSAVGGTVKVLDQLLIQTLENLARLAESPAAIDQPNTVERKPRKLDGVLWHWDAVKQVWWSLGYDGDESDLGRVQADADTTRKIENEGREPPEKIESRDSILLDGERWRWDPLNGVWFRFDTPDNRIEVKPRSKLENQIEMAWAQGALAQLPREAPDVTHDPVNAPSHYRAGGTYETIRVLKAWLSRDEFIGFLKGNALKYLSRVGAKEGAPPAQDVAKGRWYIERLLETLKEG